MDAKGFEVQNAVLMNARLVGATLADMHVHAASLVLPALLSAPLLGTDADGRVGPATALAVKDLNVTVGLTLGPSAVLKLGGLAAAASDGAAAVLVAGADGAVGTAALQALLKGMVIDGTTIAHGSVAASTTVSIGALTSGGTGAVAVQGSDGHLLSSGVTAGADGALSAASIGPTEGVGTLKIAAAELTDPAVTGGTIANAKSVTTATLEVRRSDLHTHNSNSGCQTMSSFEPD